MQRRDLVRREPKRGFDLPPWIERLLSVGIVSTDPGVVRRQRCVNVAAFALAANAGSHLVMNSLYDFHGLIVIHVYNAIMVVAALLIPRLHRLSENAAAVTLIVLIVFGNMFVVWALGITSDLHIYFTLAGAVLFMVGVQQWRLFFMLFALCLAALVFVLNFAPVDGFLLPEEWRLRDLLSTHAMINTITINAAMVFYALSTLRRAELELQSQYERSEALVAAVMPQPIAERLKSGDENIADRIDMLSVLFADLVGFTGAARNLPPEAVVAYLDGVVRCFDAECERLGVEKIKTIGDSYMAAAGLDGRAAEGAIAAGQLALAMIGMIDRQPALGGRGLQLRIGIHCGAATAGVIGDTRFSYDVWGDAVNFASRMESHGEPGRIQVSEAFRALTADAFEFEARGPIDIKGIGMTPTYLLLRARSGH
ncbi:MAG: adenylate/guanylate cyclase domain-containing protein [Xanthobacteraceae bacterium]